MHQRIQPHSALKLLAVLLCCSACALGQSSHQYELYSVAGTVGELRMRDADNSNLLVIKPPATIASNFSLTLPDALPGSTLCITVDTAGVMAYGACSGGGSGAFTDTGVLITHATATDAVSIGIGTEIGKLGIAGDDAAQYTLKVQGAAGQTAWPFVVTQSDGTTVLSRVGPGGDFTTLTDYYFYGGGAFWGRLTHSNTGDHSWTFQDAAYTVAGTNLAQTFSAAQTFNAGLVLGSSITVSNPSVYSLAENGSRLLAGYVNTMDVDALALANNAHTNTFLIQRRSADEDIIDIHDDSSAVAASFDVDEGLILNNNDFVSFLDLSGNIRNVVSSSTAGTAFGSLTTPAGNGAHIGAALVAAARSAGGTAHTAAIAVSIDTTTSIGIIKPSIGGGTVQMDIGDWTGDSWENAYLDQSVFIDEGGTFGIFDNTTPVNVATSTNGDLTLGAIVAPASNNVAYTTSLSATARSSGGTAYTTSILLEQQTDSNIVLRPTEGSTFLGSAGNPWTGFWSDGAVIGNLTIGNLTASSSVSCSGKADGTIYGTDDLYITMCIGGARYRLNAVMTSY